jgi:hypothetical protein
MFVEHSVGAGIGRGPQFALYGLSFKIDDYHFGRGQLFVGHPAGFNGKYAELPINGTYISKCKKHKAQFGQLHVGVVRRFLNVFVFTHS